MKNETISLIQNHPKYQELVRSRSRFAWLLSAWMLVVYYAFIMTIAFKPEWLAQPLGEGSVISVGIPVGIGIILFSFLLTGLYVYRANKVYEPMLEELKRDLEAQGVKA